MATIYSYPGGRWSVAKPVGFGINLPTGLISNIATFAAFSYRKGKAVDATHYLQNSGFSATLSSGYTGKTSAFEHSVSFGYTSYVGGMPLTVANGIGAVRYSLVTNSVSRGFTLVTGVLTPTGKIVRLHYAGNTGGFVATSTRVVWGKLGAISLLRRLPWGKFVRTPPSPNPNPNPDPDIQNVIPYRKAYVVVNSSALTLDLDNTPLACWGLSVSLDYQSTIGILSCTMPKASFDALDRGKEVTLHVNGNQMRFIVVRRSETRKHPGIEFSITAYTRNVLLGKEFRAEKKHASLVPCTSQQFVDLALADTGFDTVFEDFEPWQLTPNKAQCFGAPLDVAKFVAEGFGGYVLPHLTQDKLRFLPAYPVAPWVIGDSHVDLEIPMSCVTQYSSEDNVTPPCEAMYVSDGANFMARVVKQGTTGQILGESVVHSLACVNAPAASIGLKVIAGSGKVESLGISMPVLEGVPLALPGNIIKLTSRDAVGTVTGAAYCIVRKFSLSINLPTVRQALILEVLKRA